MADKGVYWKTHMVRWVSIMSPDQRELVRLLVERGYIDRDEMFLYGCSDGFTRKLLKARLATRQIMPKHSPT